MGNNSDTLKTSKGKHIMKDPVPTTAKYWYDDKGKKHLIPTVVDENGNVKKLYSPPPAKPTPSFGGSNNPGAVYTDELFNHTTGKDTKKKGKLGPATFK